MTYPEQLSYNKTVPETFLMITGHNTDITYNGIIYHVQTEDKGKMNPVVETLVYKGGEILDAKRTGYTELLQEGYDEKKIIDLIEKQHRDVIWEIREGKYDKSGIVHDPLAEGIIDSKKSLDQVILEYLASEQQKDRLVLELTSSQELVEGIPLTLTILAKNGTTGQPLKDTKIVAKIISTVRKPLTVHDGKTDRHGMVMVEFVMPEFGDGNAALLVQGFTDFGSDEVKQFIGKRKKSGTSDRKT